VSGFGLCSAGAAGFGAAASSAAAILRVCAELRSPCNRTHELRDAAVAGLAPDGGSLAAHRGYGHLAVLGNLIRTVAQHQTLQHTGFGPRQLVRARKGLAVGAARRGHRHGHQQHHRAAMLRCLFR
jgi:hypothetical protein